MINLFPAITPCAPIEQFDFVGTIGAFFDSQNVNWRGQSVQPVSVIVNGTPVPPIYWATKKIGHNDDVQIRKLPRGGVINFIRKIDPIMNWLMKGADQQQQGNTPDSQKLEAASATGNEAKLNGVVPEVAGKHLRYPDYLRPPIRYFQDTRTQMLELMLCVGPGQYAINTDEIKVGETSISALGADVEFRIFQPNEDMTNHAASDLWYVAPEVGGTSSGTAGLEISVEYTGSEENQTVATNFGFNGNQITILEPADGHWAEGLRAGSRVTEITLPLFYDVTERILTPGELPTVNRFTGNFAEILPIAVDDPVVALYNGTNVNPSSGTLVAAMSLDAQGVGWIELKSGIGGNPISSVPAGSRSLVFKTGEPHYYDVLSKSDKVITVRKFVRYDVVYVPVIDWLGFANVTSTSATITADTSSFAGDWTGPYAATPKQQKCSVTHLDFFFTRGLGSTNDEGGIESRTVQLEIAYRDRFLGGAYTSIVQTFTNATVDQIGYTVSVSHPYISPEFRVRRLGIGSADSNDYEECQWYGMKAFMAVRTSYPWTTLFLRFKSGGKIAANSENKINMLPARILPRITPQLTFENPVQTDDISAFVYHIAQSIGYTTAEIDMVEMKRLHDIWLARGETFNHVFEETTVAEAIAAVLGAGMSELTIDSGRIRPVRDEPRTLVEQAFSPQNLTGPLTRAWRNRMDDEPDGVEVEFMNGVTWEKETVICLLPGQIGAKLERMKVIGVLNRDIAWRIGMRRARQIRYQVWDHSFNTEMDALNSRYLSYVALCDDLNGYAKSAIMQQIVPAGGGNALITSSEPLDWTGGQHVVGYRDVNGNFIGPFLATRGNSDYEILAPIPQPYPPVTLKLEPPHIFFGLQEKFVFYALIKTVTPQGVDKASVTAVNYDVRIYADDNNFAPA